jgi:formylglycine-generating enzyme required for sulfatase activity
MDKETQTLPTLTSIPSPTLSQTNTLVLRSTLRAPDLIDEYGVPMMLVPAGEFEMGSQGGEIDESPIRTVFLDSYYIDQFEVTNAQYAECVNAGGCNPPSDTSSFTRSSYYGNYQYNDYPVLHVSWDDANTYCAWRGNRLPTEAEWEKAARGEKGRKYPWGNQIPDCEFANFDPGPGIPCIGDTTPVGNYPDGVSPYGVYDMAGNVWEWVSDWYDAYPDGDINAKEDYGKLFRVVRGGSWLFNVESSNRGRILPGNSDDNLGFRCSRSPGKL